MLEGSDAASTESMESDSDGALDEDDASCASSEASQSSELSSADGADEADAEARATIAAAAQSAAPFFDTKVAARPVLSPFGAAWRLLGEWVTPQSVRFVHGRDDVALVGAAELAQVRRRRAVS